MKYNYGSMNWRCFVNYKIVDYSFFFGKTINTYAI